MITGATAARESAHILWRQTTPYVKVRLAMVLMLVVVAGALTAASPVALKCIVDGLGRRSGTHRVPELLVLVTLYVLALWLGRVANQVRGVIFARAEQRIFRTLSERLFCHLMHLPLRFHLDRQTGAMSQTLENGLEGLRIILHHLVFTCVPVVVELGTITAVLVHLVAPPFLLLFCGALICYVVAFACAGTNVTKTARRGAAARVAATAVMMDGLLNYETVKYFTAEALVLERLSRVLKRAESEWVGCYRRYALNGLIVSCIFAVFLSGTAFYATDEVQRGRMTIGAFVLINTYMLQIVGPIEMLGYGMQGLSQGGAMLEKLAQLFREPTEVRTSAAATIEVDRRGSLVFRNVSLSYGACRSVLTGVSFQVQAGRTLGIVGPSGSGKSTIVRLVTRLLEPESGQIMIDDVPIAGMALQDLRRMIAVVPQDTVLFDDTVMYNIALGRVNAGADEVESAARTAQLHDFVMTLPDGYDTVVGERGVKLSGGERQRVSIARAVLKSPRIYVFDEATSALDSQTEREILHSLRAISTANTTLVIAHRLSTVVHADEIVVLENGKIVEQGAHHVLLSMNNRYATLWKAQQEGVQAA